MWFAKLISFLKHLPVETVNITDDVFWIEEKIIVFETKTETVTLNYFLP